jgi:hypothetical protein
MHDPPRMSEVERQRQWADDEPDLIQRESAPALDQLAERLPIDVLEHCERIVALEAVVENCCDRRMSQAGAEAGFLLE